MKYLPDGMKKYLWWLGMKQVPWMNENSFHFICGSRSRYWLVATRYYMMSMVATNEWRKGTYLKNNSTHSFSSVFSESTTPAQRNPLLLDSVLGTRTEAISPCVEGSAVWCSHVVPNFKATWTVWYETFGSRGWQNVEKRPTLVFFFSEVCLTPPHPLPS